MFLKLQAPSIRNTAENRLCGCLLFIDVILRRRALFKI